MDSHGRDAATAEEYERAVREREAFRGRIASAASAHGVDLWITPGATGPAPRGLATTGSSVMCLPWSHAGLPSPCVRTRRAGRLPMGLHLVGGRGADERLPAWAPAVEAAVEAGRG
ncbi:hypothetical protein [Streptomyces chryseus]|uniref:hypothetical protein n=1 Tax=Streptomyces chryseus TaxID=68186 RepID=UPI00110FD5E6|nr:hypothetical protein [Streptomyces chryseus]GGW98611.1 hypothetical protein GCM10010353_12660 [Streptomyces chryseus]